MHLTLQLDGNSVAVNSGVSAAVVGDPDIKNALVALVKAVTAKNSANAHVSLLANFQSSEIKKPTVSDEEMRKHALHALGEGRTQSLSLTITSTLVS